MLTTRREPQRDDGAALIIVIAVGAVLALFMTMLVVASVNGTKQAAADANWNAALAAAYAGIDEYQSRLAADTSYYRFGNDASPFSSASSLEDPPVPNPAFGVGTGGGWATLAGSDNRAQFRYEVDSSGYATSGRIRIRSTGKVGDATRTVVADLKQQGFIDFLYFTDFEVGDPSIRGTSDLACFTDSTKTTVKYSWAGRPMDGGSIFWGTTCHEIAFGPSDQISGPAHSNDTIRACGAVFTGPVTTAKATSPYYVARNSNGNVCTAATFTLAGYPAYSGGVIGMPATNSQLKKETRSDLGSDGVPRPGCLYTGPTQFTFIADGTVNIKSPFTKMTRTGDASSSAAGGSTPAECGVISQLQSPGGATITVPENIVMYVQNVPAVSGDANYWATGTTPTGFNCVSSGSNGKRGWSLGSDAAGNRSGYPITTGSPDTTEVSPTANTYGCRAGDIFVKGDVNGSATLAAEKYIFVVGDVEYVDKQDDILGLVGNNAVWVWNPLNSGDDALNSDDRTIEAAILSVAHTFQVQNYDDGGSQGTLTVNGAIAQKYRGVVSDGSNGYDKNYIYDERFKVQAPPKFLNPITTTYGVTSWVESAAVWNPDGSAR